jgi:pimeloyl-ACP methyl ester carboxylesterase
MQTNRNPQVVTKLAIALSFAAVICSAQSQNVGAVGRGVSISFQNASGSTDRGISIGFQDSSGTIQVTTTVAAAAFTIKGPATYTGSGLTFTKTNAPAGTYTITYGVVPGYTTPVSETKALSAGATLAFTGSYAPLPGIGRIQVTTNLAAAGFTVEAMTVTPGFVSFTKTGKFYDTGMAVPTGTYRITFAPVSGYFTPSTQTLSLGAGATLQFVGTYRRIIVVLFTGLGAHPSNNSVIYPDDDCPSGTNLFGWPNCAGMVSLATSLRTDTPLKDGILARTFTYYSLVDYANHSDPWDYPPSDSSIHAVADNWIRNEVKATSDDQIVVIGHSYGGNRARLFASQLSSAGVSASLLVPVDPISWDACHGGWPQEVIDALAGVCTQEGDLYTQTKDPSIADVLAFTQVDSLNIRGYHFQNYPYSIIGNLGCPAGENVCSHVMITYDPSMFNSIISRVRSLKSSPQQLIYGISLANIDITSAAISWKTSSTATGGLVYSLNADATTGSVEVADSLGVGTNHSATLSGLLANTRYYFKVRAKIPGSQNSEFSSIGFFQTSQPAPIIKASSPVLTRDANGVSLTVTLTNSGAPATNGTMTAASIGASRATASFPQPIPDLATGTSFYPVIPFSANLGASGSTVAPIITVKYSGSTFAVPVPPVKVP